MVSYNNQEFRVEKVRQQERMCRYYRFQSKIYDWTRWAFLFGRTRILKKLGFDHQDKFRIMEVGCGTGFNLDRIARKYPNVELVGIDVSENMLEIAEKKLKKRKNKKVFHPLPYGKDTDFLFHPPDIILFSYSLTMINPQWPELLEKAYRDLPEGGKILVIDFHDSRFQWFKSHLGNHHVRMDRHLLPELQRLFKPIESKVNSAYMGVWQYFLFVGEK